MDKLIIYLDYLTFSKNMKKPFESGFRREGFAGQRLVVLPKTVAARASEHPLLRGLLPTDAGFFPAAAGHLVERASGADGFVVIVCLTGRGWFSQGRGGDTHIIAPGDVLWFSPRKPHAYGADQAHPWSIEWAHFQGTEAAAWGHELGLKATAQASRITLGPSEAGRIGLRQVHTWLEAGYTTINLLAASAALRTSLTEIARRRSRAGAGRSASDAVATSMARIDERLDQPVSLAELAAEAGLSVSHYSMLFRAHTGYAPIDFLLRRRMQLAARLLDTTPLRIEEVATRLGYTDAYYFSRVFKRFVGHSPRAYRAIKKG
ncbi:MAG: AraC family transcriptional regulator [Verrucomicrobia bacterium]|nr:MAG: AraC family transcriptional regulator [Verrucomicrobiota bacterium]